MDQTTKANKVEEKKTTEVPQSSKVDTHDENVEEKSNFCLFGS